MNYLKIAEEFGKKAWTYKEVLKIKDIMLFGSVAYGKQNPNDLDLLILHYNKIFDKFQDTIDLKNIPDSKKLRELSKLLKKDIDISKILQGTDIEKLILQNKFNTKYMNVKFFTDSEYRENWIEKDRKIHGHEKPKLRYNRETFEDTMFRQGKLWNSKTEKYDIPAKSKYQIPKKIIPRKNQPLF